MRVLQLINSLGTGGAEKLLLDALPRYLEAGVSMELLLLDGKPHPFLEELKKSPCKIHVLSKGSVYNPLHIFKIIPFLKQFDLVHVHLFPALYWVALAKVLSFSKTPLIFTEHNTSNRRRGWLFKIVDRFMYGRYSRIVIITSEVGALLKKHIGDKKGKFQLIHNGVALDNIEKATAASISDFHISEEEKILIQVSSFTEQKDQETLIKSLLHIKPATHLLLVGTGPRLDHCKHLVKDLGLKERVHFLGIRMDVPQLLKMAHIVVLSSHYEGLSLSSIEGLASGNPFVASEVPGLTEVVEGAGVLFPEGDEKLLAAAINKLFESTTYYKEVTGLCLDRAKKYSIEKMIQEHLALYTQLCKNQN
jgi:glycosyltransferase involved in cell wall biosynthesis